MSAGLPTIFTIKQVINMDGFALNILLSYSVIIPAIIGIIRFTSISCIYYSFIFLIWLGFINETLSIILVYTLKSNTINSNIYVLIEYFFILFQLYKWNGSDIKKNYFFVALGLAIWIGDNLIINAGNGNNSIFRIFYSLVIVFFSINMINKLIIYERKNLLKNAIFLICISFLLYYGCKAFVEVFNAFHLGLSDIFNRNIFKILYFANLISNIMYAIAILCIPRKQEFSLLS